MKTFNVLLLAFLLALSGGLYAETQDSETQNTGTQKLTSIIDVPTAAVIEYSNYDLNFRLHGTGGILSNMTFGVFKPINIGISWDLDNLIGPGSTNVDTRPPAIFFKAKLFSGDLTIPAIAMGYDGQGYGPYNTDTEKYQDREKGVFLVFSREYFVPGLEVSAGGNIYDFQKSGVYGFAGVDYSLEDKVFLLAEYDNIKLTPQNRANAGVNILVTDNVSLELAGRDLFKGTQSERIAIISYKGKF